MTKSAKGGYPFQEPSTDYERAWWDELRRLAQEAPAAWRAEAVEQVKLWAPVLRAMTPAEREEFHSDRHYAAAKFDWHLDSARGGSERYDAGKRLVEKWRKRLGERVAA